MEYLLVFLLFVLVLNLIVLQRRCLTHVKTQLRLDEAYAKVHSRFDKDLKYLHSVDIEMGKGIRFLEERDKYYDEVLSDNCLNPTLNKKKALNNMDASILFNKVGLDN